MRPFGVALLALWPSLVWGGEAACTTYDHAPRCCPHPPPACCPAELDAPLDDRAVTEICGAAGAKGQAAAFNACKRYFERGENLSEVVLGREPGDAAAFDKLRNHLAGGRTRVSAATVTGAQQAFLVRELDDTGNTSRSSAWALVAGEILHVEAERPLCDEQQVLRLLQRALEHRAKGRSPTGATSARRPG